MFLLSTVGSMAEKQQKGLPWVQECLALLLCLACQAGRVDPVWGEKRDCVKTPGQKHQCYTEIARGSKHHSAQEMVFKHVSALVV